MYLEVMKRWPKREVITGEILGSGRLRRGFTLIEGIFSMFLIFLILGALVFTLKQAGSVKSNFTNMGELSEVVHAISVLRADINAALNISVPSPGGSSNQLELNRIDPELYILDRITPLPHLGAGPADLEPFEPKDTSEVQYFLATNMIKRRIVNASGREWTEQLIACEAFEVLRERNPDQLTMTLEVKNTRRVRKHTVKVALR